jgi:hypothetical protein
MTNINKHTILIKVTRERDHRFIEKKKMYGVELSRVVRDAVFGITSMNLCQSIFIQLVSSVADFRVLHTVFNEGDPKGVRLIDFLMWGTLPFMKEEGKRSARGTPPVENRAVFLSELLRAQTLVWNKHNRQLLVKWHHADENGLTQLLRWLNQIELWLNQIELTPENCEWYGPLSQSRSEIPDSLWIEMISSQIHSPSSFFDPTFLELFMDSSKASPVVVLYVIMNLSAFGFRYLAFQPRF